VLPKKIFVDASCDDPRAALSGAMRHLQPAAAVRDDERFVAAASYDLSQTVAIAAGFSTATTASPSAGTLHCSSAPSEVSAEISFHILSTDTLAFAAAVIGACSAGFSVAVAFSVELTDLE